jgi:hypothetical protein
MLNEEQKDWNDTKNRIQDIVEKLIKAKK